ncbi:MAG TPA: PEP-CTERM sorting domain-containing protein [Tepidisphaeraceae bacterium]
MARRGALGALAVAGLCMMRPATAHGQLIEGFENTLDGWTYVPTYNPTDAGYAGQETFSTTTGVTQGSYALVVNSGAVARTLNGLDYGNFMVSPRTTTLESLLAGATSITIDYNNPGNLAYGPQIDLDIDGATGYNSLDGYGYPTPPLGQSTAVYSLTSAERSAMAADLASATPIGVNLVLQIGGPAPSAINTPLLYIDNIQAVQPVPEPASIGMLGIGAAYLLKRRRKA